MNCSQGLCKITDSLFQDEDLQYAEIDLPESDLPPPPKETTVYAEMNEEQPIARTNTE
jgi:hypothetical protein